MNNQKGFTLIELVVVIVILGILSAVAIPKFVDMRTEAKEAAANGVFGAANAAAALNHSAKLVGKATTPITTGTSLITAMEGLPEGWVVDDAGGDGAVGLSLGASGTDVAAAEYSVIVFTSENGSNKAVITKGGTVSW